MKENALDTALLELLRSNSRESVTTLAGRLGVSRATVQEHMQRLQRTGVIQGYTIRFHPDYLQQRVGAHVMISVGPRTADAIVAQLSRYPFVDSLYTISGQYDLVAMIHAKSTELLDQHIDAIAALEGVEKTLTSVLLSQKLQR